MNQQLIQLAKAWKATGLPSQRGFDWSASRDNWKLYFAKESNHISALNTEIDRAEVRRVMESDKHTIREKFITVMIWGYGNRGYGPYRVGQMLGQAHSESVLTQVYLMCQQGDSKRAYEFMSRNRLPQLSPAFGTKFLSFCSSRDKAAPIYDALVAQWIRDFAAIDFEGISTSSVGWRIKTYSRYVDWISEHAKSIECFPDEIEQILFQDAEQRYSRTRIKG